MSLTCPDCIRGDIDGAVDIKDHLPCPRCHGSGILPNYWRTKEGEILFIPDMGDEHILNCMKMLRKIVPQFRIQHEIIYVASLPTPRTDLGQDGLNHELEQMAEMDDVTWLENYFETYKEFMVVTKERGIA